MVISQALKDVTALDEKIKKGAKVMAYWRQWEIDYRKQHPKVEGDPISDKAKVVEPGTMTGEELASLRKCLGPVLVGIGPAPGVGGGRVHLTH